MRGARGAMCTGVMGETRRVPVQDVRWKPKRQGESGRKKVCARWRRGRACLGAWRAFLKGVYPHRLGETRRGPMPGLPPGVTSGKTRQGVSERGRASVQGVQHFGARQGELQH